MVNLNPRDPRDDYRERELADETRSQYREPELRDPADVSPATYIVGGAAALLALVGILWAASNDASNQQSAANQPPAPIERPADRTQPEVPPAPQPSPPAP